MGLKLLQYYTTKRWEFRNERFQEMSSQLSLLDQDLFDTSVGQVNWETYISNYIVGMRTYILGESEDTLPQARKVLRRLYILDWVSKVLFFSLSFWFLWTHLDGFVNGAMPSSDPRSAPFTMSETAPYMYKLFFNYVLQI